MIQQTISILQPNPYPTLDWLARYLLGEVVWFTSGDRWTRKGFTHRFKIRDDKHSFWVTLPIRTEDRSKPIDQIRIDMSSEWKLKTFRTLETCYKNSIYYDLYRAEIQEDIEIATDKSLLVDVISYLNQRLMYYLGIHQREIIEKRTIEEVYGSLQKNDTSVVWQMDEIKNIQRPLSEAHPFPFTIPTYRQHFSSFVPKCSSLDLLFEVGSDSFHIFDNLKKQLNRWNEE